MAAASTLSPALSAATGAAAGAAAGTAFGPVRRRSPSPGVAALRSAAVTNAAAARCPPNDPNLRTPLSSTYPSSLHSPRPGSLTPLIKTPSDPEKTPLTPPSAYIDFLRTLSPNPCAGSPLSTGTSTHFSFGGASSPRWPSSAAFSGKSPIPRSFPAPRSFGHSRAASSASPRPSSAVSSAALSAAAGPNAQRDSVSAPPATDAASAPRANSGRAMKRPGDLNFTSARLPPNNTQSVPSPTGMRPQSARQNSNPKLPSLVIPPSPSSSVTSMSPSQHSAPARSAYPSSAHPDKSAIPTSAVSNKGRSPLSACVSATEATGNASPVTIRHVVTRTVTYRRPAGGSAASALAAAAGTGDARAAGVTSAPRQARARMQSPLSAVEAVSDDDDEEAQQDDDGKRQPPRLVGDVPKGKRRKVE